MKKFTLIFTILYLFSMPLNSIDQMDSISLISSSNEQVKNAEVVEQENKRGIFTWIRANPKKAAFFIISTAAGLGLSIFGAYKLLKKEKDNSTKKQTGLKSQTSKSESGEQEKPKGNQGQQNKVNDNNLDFKTISESQKRELEAKRIAEEKENQRRKELAIEAREELDKKFNVSSPAIISSEMKANITEEDMDIIKDDPCMSTIIERLFPGKYTDHQRSFIASALVQSVYRDNFNYYDLKGLEGFFIHSRINDLFISKEIAGDSCGDIIVPRNEYMKIMNLYLNKRKYCKQHVLESPSTKIALELASDEHNRKILSDYRYNSKKHGNPLYKTIDNLMTWEIKELDNKIAEIESKLIDNKVRGAQISTMYPHFEGKKGTFEIYMEEDVVLLLMKKVKGFKEKNNK